MKKKDWVRDSISGRKLLREFPKDWNEGRKVSARKEILEKLCNVSLNDIEADNGVLEKAKGRNIENTIGVVKVPLGVAGPLQIVIDVAGGEYFVPLATTEGALVASINRGCRAIVESGGARVESTDAGVTRGPVFRVENIDQGERFVRFLEKKFSKLKEVAEASSNHLKLKSFSIDGVGRYRYVRFCFDTKEAMGMNMVTIATDAMVRLIEKETGIRCLSVTGNFCVDKKPAWQNFIKRRGRSVRAEVVLSAQVVGKILKTSVRQMYEVWLAKCMIGSALSGSMGFNAQYANVVAAIFLATGQDMAHVTEGSLGMTAMEISAKGKGLYVSVYLPDLMLGTVGGGTRLPSQNSALKLLGLGLGKSGEAKKLAEIVAGTVLAGEVSLIASLAEGSLARAHKRLGRGKKRRL